MKTRTCGPVTTSLLGFGCMRLPEDAPGHVDREKAFAMLDAARAAGVTYYDTAHPYHGGDSERVLGEWLKTQNRDALLVADKLSAWMTDGTRAGAKAMLDSQLETVGVDHFDFYLLHALSAERFAALEAIDIFSLLDEWKAAGKIRQAGFSFHDNYEVFERILNAYPWDFCQLQLNYMDTDVQAGLKGYELAKAKGVRVMVMEPVKGGALANPPADVRAVFDALHPEWSGASWALRWVAGLDNVAVVLSGMSTLEQVADNVSTFAGLEPLTGAEQAAVDKAAAVYHARTRVPCTGCAYCMPCPAGVDIPAVFRVFNHGGVFGDDAGARAQYGRMDAKTVAGACVACGKCKQACPQHIDVPAEMRRIAAWAEESR